MFHKEGFKIIALTSLPVVISIILADTFIIDAGFKMGVQLVVLLCFLCLLQFFRNPNVAGLLFTDHTSFNKIELPARP